MVTTKDVSTKSAAEGIEALKEVAGSVTDALNVLAGGIRSGMGYVGQEIFRA